MLQTATDLVILQYFLRRVSSGSLIKMARGLLRRNDKVVDNHLFSTTECHRQPKNNVCETSFSREKGKLLSCQQLTVLIFSCRQLVSQTMFFGCRRHLVVDKKWLSTT